jgi:methionine sulfoxide reductase heme-binding subunit
MPAPRWRTALTSPWAKAAVWIACLAPLALLVWGFLQDDLGANPIEKITRDTGTWTLRFLVIGLAITPLRKLAGWPELIKYRRLIGLFAFFYGTVHLSTYLWLDQFFDWDAISKDIWKRRFITAGMVSFAAMLPLAFTSTAGWIRRIGGKRWQTLHRLVYLAAIAGVVHYYWLVKSDVRLPVLYGALVGVLLLWRGWTWFQKRSVAPTPARTTTPA